MQVLSIDIGNSRTKFGLFRINAGRLTCLEEWVIDRHEPPLPLDQIRSHAGSASEFSSIIAASDPDRVGDLLDCWPSDWKAPQIIEGHGQLPIEVAIDRPETVGIDRLLNGIAAARLRDRSVPVIVIDSGTATTVDLIDTDGRFCGGAILPGVELSAHALHDYTARLPRIPLEELSCPPELPGQETHSAIRAGLLFGQLGAIREIAGRMPSGPDQAWMLTGGAGPLLRNLMPEAQWYSNLALQGLAWTASCQADQL